MIDESPFVLTVYDKAFGRKGTIGAPRRVRMTPRHNDLGTGEVELPSDHHLLSDLVAEGARLVCEYDGKHLLGGPVRLLRGDGPRSTGTVTLTVEDDWRLLRNVLGWPVPSAALTAQTPAYETRSGPAETVFKGFVTSNIVNRLQRPVTVAVSQGRGAAIRVSMRMHPLADRLIPQVDHAGVGTTVRQSGAGFLVDCYVPTLYPQTLTEDSGVVQNWAWSRSAPTATRVVAGDQGELTARSWTSTVDTVREAAWGDVIERAADARDTDDPATVTARRAEVLAEGAARAGLSLTLAETEGFRYGTTIKVGDRVKVEVGPKVFVEDVLREAVLSWSVEDGLVVEPVVGERTDDPNTVLVKAVAQLGRAFRGLGAGK